MTQNINQNILYIYTQIIYGYAVSKFLPARGFKCIDPKKFDLDENTSDSSKGCVFEVGLEYSKELRELNNDYPLAPGKTVAKREILSE